MGSISEHVNQSGRGEHSVARTLFGDAHSANLVQGVFHGAGREIRSRTGREANAYVADSGVMQSSYTREREEQTARESRVQQSTAHPTTPGSHPAPYIPRTYAPSGGTPVSKISETEVGNHLTMRATIPEYYLFYTKTSVSPRPKLTRHLPPELLKGQQSGAIEEMRSRYGQAFSSSGGETAYSRTIMNWIQAFSDSPLITGNNTGRRQ